MAVIFHKCPNCGAPICVHNGRITCVYCGSSTNLKHDLAQLESYPRDFLGRLPRVFCMDGFSVSIQCNEFTYCEPRKNDAAPYLAFGLGYPSVEDPGLSEYADVPENSPNTVYGRVPRAIVERILEMHCGVDWKKTGFQKK